MAPRSRAGPAADAARSRRAPAWRTPRRQERRGPPRSPRDRLGSAALPCAESCKLPSVDAIDPARVAELAAEHGFADIGADLADLALWGFRLGPRDGAAELGATKLGGLPDLPEGVDWPVLGDRPLWFAGQVNTSELGDSWPGPVPGLLLFFCVKDPETDEVGAAHVVVAAPGSALRLAQPHTPTDGLLPESAVEPRRELTLPALGVTPAVALQPFGFDYDQPRYDDTETYFGLLDALANEQGLSGPTHRLLGHPLHVQNDVLVSIVSESTRGRGSWEELEDESRNWRLLLQIDSDRHFGDSFADGGSIYFGLPADDLPGSRFDRV